MRLIDVHSHLHDARYAGNRDAIIVRAQQAGVTCMVTCGVDERDWVAAAALCGEFPIVLIPSFGLHPWFVAEASEAWELELRRNLADPRALVGEIGLDFAIKDFSRELQERFFIRQLQIARELERPVTIHCRGAWARTLEILTAHPLPAGGLVHSFSGAAEMVAPLERLGFYISFSGSLTKPDARKVHRACQAVSAERLLIETDSPDILPAGAAGPLNEPANILLVAEQAAELRGCTVEEIAALTSGNWARLWGRGGSGLPSTGH